MQTKPCKCIFSRETTREFLTLNSIVHTEAFITVLPQEISSNQAELINLVHIMTFYSYREAAGSKVEHCSMSQAALCAGV